MRFWNFWNYS